MVADAGTLGRRTGDVYLRPRRAAIAGVAILLASALAGLVVDDLRVRRDLPHESGAAHAYMAAMVENDPAEMWASYSASARRALGGDEAAFVAYMRLGTHPRSGPANPFALVAAVPLDTGETLLFYRVTLVTAAEPSHILVPVVIDPAGAVEEAGGDGLFFAPPQAP
jgi:hypothetical protein